MTPNTRSRWRFVGGAFLIALFRGALTWRIFLDVLADSTRTTAILFTVSIGALIFSNFVNRAGLPDGLLALVTSNDLSPLMVIAIIICIYIVLGYVFESLSMLLLTIPVFFPVVKELSYAGLGGEEILVWFGIVAVMVTEISLITPPVGLNVFVLSGVIKDVSTGTIFKGVTPFWCADILRLAVIVAIPAISLYLPGLFYH